MSAAAPAPAPARHLTLFGPFSWTCPRPATFLIGLVFSAVHLHHLVHRVVYQGHKHQHDMLDCSLFFCGEMGGSTIMICLNLALALVSLTCIRRLEIIEQSSSSDEDPPAGRRGHAHRLRFVIVAWKTVYMFKGLCYFIQLWTGISELYCDNVFTEGLETVSSLNTSTLLESAVVVRAFADLDRGLAQMHGILKCGLCFIAVTLAMDVVKNVDLELMNEIDRGVYTRGRNRRNEAGQP